MASVTIELPVWNAKHLVWEISILCCCFSLTSFVLTPWTTFLSLYLSGGLEWFLYRCSLQRAASIGLARFDSALFNSSSLSSRNSMTENPTPNPSCGVAQWLQQRKRVQLGVSFHSCVTEACECELHVDLLWRLRNSRLRRLRAMVLLLACQLASSRFFLVWGHKLWPPEDKCTCIPVLKISLAFASRLWLCREP